MTTLLYVLGGPGAGKTTLCRDLIAARGWTTTPVEGRFPYRAHGPNAACWDAVSLGRDRPPFSGTDTLSWTIAPRVLGFLAEAPAPLVIGEGDRLASKHFLGPARDTLDLLLVALLPPPEVAAERRARRALQYDLKPQNPTWIETRNTKHARLADELDAIVLPWSDPLPTLLSLLED